MENVKYLVEMAEALARTKNSIIERIDIQYNNIAKGYSAYCYIKGCSICYKINEDSTIEIVLYRI